MKNWILILFLADFINTKDKWNERLAIWETILIAAIIEDVCYQCVNLAVNFALLNLLLISFTNDIYYVESHRKHLDT